MKRVYPDYYGSFACTAGACRHSCCIGWEIDVDEDTLAYYRGLGGEIGARLRASLSSEGGDPHFVLDSDGRCPFLNRDGLCDLILELGEDALSEICAEHPRFYNGYAGRLECGVGLSCSAAARLVLLREDPVTLVTEEEPEWNSEEDPEEEVTDPAVEERLRIRDLVLRELQVRGRWFVGRIVEAERVSGAVTAHIPHRTHTDFLDLLAGEEHLDPAWTRLIDFTRRVYPSITERDFRAFERHMEGRQTEYEQFLVYWLYRYFGNAVTPEEKGTELILAGSLYDLLTVFGTAIYRETGDFTPDTQVELVRLLSSEIEYCEESLAELRAFLSGDPKPPEETAEPNGTEQTGGA